MKTLDHLNSASDKFRTVELTPKTGIPSQLTDQTRYELAPGEYVTGGIRMVPEGRNHFVITDPKNTIIRFVPGSRFNNTPSLFMCDGLMMEFYCEGLRADLNWDAFEGERLVFNRSFKLTAFGALRCWQGKVVDFEVINGGACGKTGDSWNEAFIVRLDTYRGGRPGEKLPIPYVEIGHGKISKVHFEPGGYGTGVFTQTNQGVAAGDRFVIGTRESLAAHIHDIEIDIPGGIGIGCGGVGEGGGSEQVLFERIKVTRAMCGHNMDTGSAYNITIQDSEFHCSAGINFSGANKEVEINNNTIVIGEPFFNQITGTNEPQYGVRLQNNSDSVVDRNTFFSPLGVEQILGAYEGDNEFLKLSEYKPEEPAPATDPEILRLAEIGRKWEANSSLEEWFPISAEELKRLKEEIEKFRAKMISLTAERREILVRTHLAESKAEGLEIVVTNLTAEKTLLEEKIDVWRKFVAISKEL